MASRLLGLVLTLSLLLAVSGTMAAGKVVSGNELAESRLVLPDKNLMFCLLLMCAEIDAGGSGAGRNLLIGSWQRKQSPTVLLVVEREKQRGFSARFRMGTKQGEAMRLARSGKNKVRIGEYTLVRSVAKDSPSSGVGTIAYWGIPGGLAARMVRVSRTPGGYVLDDVDRSGARSPRSVTLTLSAASLKFRSPKLNEDLHRVAAGFKPSASDYTKGRRVIASEMDKVSISYLKQLQLASWQYAQDHNRTLPDFRSQDVLQRSLMPYLKSVDVFTVPGTNKLYRANAALAKLPWKRVEAMKAIHAPMFWEPTPSSAGTRGVAFVGGGDPRRLSEAEFAKLAREYNVR